ncbi:MAG: rRNA maturation RNase YbeY [Flavobacteriales bacterium]|nr:MAG: rRNA maturation RNase YbeY [Flavobacteriales bacterium]
MTSQKTISFLSEDISFELEHQNDIQNWIQDAISKEGKTTGEITYIFCSDEYLHKINKEYLQHNTYTDIITFNYCVDDIINSDVFISIDRVKENSEAFKTTFQNELSRVIIHGILHLIGYDDKSGSDKEVMCAKEDFYLSLLST